MVVFALGMAHLSNEEGSESKGRYYFGIAVTVAAWIVVAFVV